jgi:hypothetical protein
MTITTETGLQIKTSETPHWNEFHKRWYVWGARWIKSRGVWSTVIGLHNFNSYQVTEG